jgi:hypothetical protein
MNEGKPSSLTSIAFNTGVTLERDRIIKLLNDLATQAPMRGDVALNDLRQLIQEEKK